MKGYSTREVAELLELSPSQVRAFAREGLIAPERGRRGGYRFRFEDIVLLRAAKALQQARVPPRRIWRALRSLREQLPRGQPLGSVRIIAEGDRVVVHRGESAWDPDSGQFSFAFSVAELADRAAPMMLAAASAADRDERQSADEWFDLGLELETVGETADAQRAYARALTLDPVHAEAHVNLGRLLHEAGAFDAAEAHYRRACEADAENATAAFNLGTVLEDLGRSGEAAEAYARALALDPGFADAHYNLASLYERRGDRAAALRHLVRYRALTRAAGERT